MGARTASSRSTRTASTQSGSIAVIGDPTTDTTNDYVLTGSGATSSAVFTELLPESNAATSITSVIAPGTPIISNVAYTNSSYNILAGNTSANLSGAYASVFGTGFQSNSNVFINGSLVSNTRVDSTRINLALPNVSVTGTYNLMVFNSNNLAALTTLSYNTGPVWIQSSFSSIFGTVSLQLTATGAVLYTITPGSSLPEGLSLNSATGLMTGTLAAATYSFSVTATNQTGLTTAQTVTIAIGTNYTVSYLVVAGGGSGGTGPSPIQWQGAGGGGGGVQVGSYNSLVSDTFTVGIGPGGPGTGSPGSLGSGSRGQYGGNSYVTGTTLGNVVSIGGGAGGYGPVGGFPGGSGGGSGSTAPPSGGRPVAGAGYGFPSPAALFYTPVGAQGYPGGSGWEGPGLAAGGGGGAGGSAPAVSPFLGGPGYTWPVNGVTYAAGAAGYGPVGAAGTGNGGGGNGGNGVGPSNAGGSGVVIIAYPSVPGAQIGSGGTVTTTGTGPTLYYLHTYTAPGTYTASTTPTWVTASQTFTYTYGTPFTNTLVATDISTITYSLSAGNTLPSGVTLSSNGVLAGTISSGTTYSFYIDAINGIGVKTNRLFNLGLQFTAQFLAVGGGGASGGNQGPIAPNPSTQPSGHPGGGGAGAFSNGTASIITGVTYTIAVGFGGVGPTLGPSFPGSGTGNNGWNSNIASPGGTLIVDVGGGGGGGSSWKNNTTTLASIVGTAGAPGSGGGGGGAGGTQPGFGPPAIGSGTYPGGPGNDFGGGVGGGAGAPGGPGGSGPQAAPATSASGGDGVPNSITGSPVIYAAGGGNPATTPGAANTGNGGYTSGQYASNRPGGPGVVILSVPTALYNAPGLAGTATATPIGPGQTVITFTGPGTYTA